MSAWHGAVHYISTFAVVKPDSMSMRMRIVSNSAMVNSVSKLSLNQCMWNRPNVLADLLDCLIFWRGVAIAIMMDLKKAYQAIHTSPTKLHLRQFFYCKDPRDSWQTLAYTRATFGDVAAGLLLEIANRKVAVLGEDIDPLAAVQLKNLSFADDGVLGGSHKEVERMRRDRVEGVYSGTVERILAKGGMSMKFMAITGSDEEYEAAQLAGKFLGINYDIKADQVTFSLQPCYYESKQHCSDVERKIILLGAKEVGDLAGGARVLTRQNALSLVMGVYNPLGLISAAVVKGKLLLRHLYTPEISTGWDMDTGHPLFREATVGIVVCDYAGDSRNPVSSLSSSCDSQGPSSPSRLLRCHRGSCVCFTVCCVAYD